MAQLRPLLIVVSFLSCIALSAQEAVVRRDTQLPVELTNTIKSHSAKVGDKVKFRLNEAVLIGNNIVVPEGAKIFGVVEAVRDNSDDQPHSLVRIRIDRLEWKKGSARLNAVVLSVEPTPAQSIIMSHRRRRPPLPPPSFMLGIRIKAHVRRDAYVEFFSDKKDLTLHSGMTFVLRQIDPDHNPATMGRDSTIDLNPR
jgi:hypothetical protein